MFINCFEKQDKVDCLNKVLKAVNIWIPTFDLTNYFCIGRSFFMTLQSSRRW